MGERTGISWTDATWNPWHGCIKVSPGCKFCYMYREKKQYGQDPTAIVRSKTKFNDPLRWQRTGKLQHGQKIFTCSWSDFFIEQADEWRPEAWEIIKKTQEFVYQILTKRPENIPDRLPPDWGIYGYKNVWLGVSAENQNYYDIRFVQLRSVPAAVYFISVEPFLDYIDLCLDLYTRDRRRPEWIITGCESGSDRQTPLEMFRHLAKQCVEDKTPFWMKQMEINGKVTEDISLFPPDLRIRQMPDGM